MSACRLSSKISPSRSPKIASVWKSLTGSQSSPVSPYQSKVPGASYLFQCVSFNFFEGFLWCILNCDIVESMNLEDLNFMPKGSNRTRLNRIQLESLITFMKNNSDLALCALTANFKRSDRRKKWIELSKILNKVGPTKTPDQWRRTWNDQKCNVKAKFDRIQRSAAKSGVVTVEDLLSDTEIKLLSVLNISIPSSEECVVIDIPEKKSNLEVLPVASDPQISSDSKVASLPEVSSNSKVTIVPEVSSDSKETLVPEVSSDSKETLVPEVSSNFEVISVSEVPPVSKIISDSEVPPVSKIISSEVPPVSSVISVPEIPSASKYITVPELPSVSKYIAVPEISSIPNLIFVPEGPSISKVILFPDVSSISKVISVPEVTPISKVISVPEVTPVPKVTSVSEFHSMETQPIVCKTEITDSVESLNIQNAEIETSNIVDSGAEETLKRKDKKRKERRKKLNNAIEAAESLRDIVEIQNKALLMIAESSQRQAEEASKQTLMLSELIKELKSLTESVQSLAEYRT